MYKKIMVPVDLEHTEKIEKALDGAAELAKSYDLPVCYVAVMGRVPNRVAPSPEKFEAELNMFAREQGDKHGIKTECKAVPSVDVPVELDDKLLEAIDDVGADLVVMASHIPGVADKLHLISSNAAYMVKHSEVSIFVVR
ncbi:MAG: universal stress protein [Wenzhouxiangellaceae bacterium]|nr:universal stress protein [Wenzhouxiangellaceae bacterium]MBS3747409.1 universal stress protein [Wenzhouxiangellaceae bacterium]MBS3823898.1 universal stress protein [Wenzhouxiangellaceae bacterium]